MCRLGVAMQHDRFLSVLRVCGEKLSKNATAPSKLKGRFTIKSNSPACKDITCFRRLMQQYKKGAKFTTSSV
jgi:hypothetical protein